MTAVAADFGLPSDRLLENWVETLVDLRNICAHHDRLFNRIFQKQPSRLRNANVPTAIVPSNRLRAVLQCLDHMMTSRGALMSVEAEAGRILGRYPEITLAEAGY